MDSTLKPRQGDDPHDFLVVAPDVVRVAPVDEELSTLLHDLASSASAPHSHMMSDSPVGSPVPAVDTTFRPAATDSVKVPGHLRSIGGRAARRFTVTLLTACLGAAAIAWQSYGDTARQMIADWVPQFVLTSSPPAETPALAAQAVPSGPAETAASATPVQPAPAAQAVAPAVVAPSPESAQLLQSMARDLAAVGQEVEQLKASIEQLKASQQQMSRDIARVSEVKSSEAKSAEAKSSEQSPRPRAPSPRSAAMPAHRPMPSYRPRQAAAAPALAPAAAPYVPRQAEPQPPVTPPQLSDPELASVPRPPMPLR